MRGSHSCLGSRESQGTRAQSSHAIAATTASGCSRGIDRGSNAMLIYVAGTSPQDPDHLATSADSLTGHRRCLECGVSSKYQGETRQPAARAPVWLTEAHFVRANSRVAVDQTGAGAFLNFSAIAFCHRQRYPACRGTDTEHCRRHDSARVEPGAAACCRLWHWRE